MELPVADKIGEAAGFFIVAPAPNIFRFRPPIDAPPTGIFLPPSVKSRRVLNVGSLPVPLDDILRTMLVQ